MRRFVVNSPINDATMHATDTLAFELAAALDAYEEQLAAVRRRPTADAAAQLQRRLHRVCHSCPGLPQLAAATVALMLAHHGLLSDLMRDGRSERTPSVQPSMQALEQSVRSLQRQCREMFLAPYLH